MRKLLVALLLAVTCSVAQRTLVMQPVGTDTFRIKADACLWTRGWLQWTTDSLNARTTEPTFGRAYGFIGATVQYGPHAYARYYYDLGEISGKPAYDLFAALTGYGIDFRFGQLKLPLGYEVMCAPWKTDFIDNSLLASYRTPTTATRDIGAMLTYNHRYAQPSLAILNGNGRNMTKDNNPYKDIVFRLVASPLGNQNLVVGGNLYWGNDTFATSAQPRPFRRFAAELLWTRPNHFLRAELVTGNDSLATGNAERKIFGLYAAAGFRAAGFQPVLRYERFTVNSKLTSTLTFGLNCFIFHDMVKPMLDISLVNDEAKRADFAKVMFQLQTAFW